VIVKLTKNIRKIYKKKGVKAPNGRGIHSEKFHDMVSSITKSYNATDPNKVYDKDGKKINPYSIAMAKLGKTKAVKKSHRRKASEAILIKRLRSN